MILYTCIIVLVLIGTFLYTFTKLNSNSQIINYETSMKIGNQLTVDIKVNKDPPEIEKATKLNQPNDNSKEL